MERHRALEEAEMMTDVGRTEGTRPPAVLAVAFMAVIAVVPVEATWYEVGGGTGDARMSILQGSRTSTTFEVTVPGMEVTPETVGVEVFQRLQIPGARTAALTNGRPELPCLTALLGIPGDASVSVSIVAKETVCLKLHNVYPLQPEELWGPGSSQFVFDTAFYSLDTVYTGVDYAEMNTAYWRDLKLLNIQVYPVQVNPARDTVVVLSRLKVTVQHQGSALPSSAAPWLASLYARIVDNFQCLGIDAGTDNEPGARYLVFCPSKFASNVWLTDSLLGWMHTRGYEWKIVDSSTFDSAQIKSRVRQEYYSHNPPVLRWVLLVGDCADVPSPRFWKKKWGEHRAVAASDHWYADFVEYGSLDSCDDYPEVGIARLSVSDMGDLTRQIVKVLSYERPASVGPWMQKMTLVAHQLVAQSFPRLIRDIDDCIHHLWSYYEPSTDTIIGRNSGVSNATVSYSVNNGTGVLLYAGHGGLGRWIDWNMYDQDWTCNEVRGLANGESTPVVLTLACSTGFIPSDTCLAESWMRKFPGGAVASLGCSDTSTDGPGKAQCSTLVRTLCDADSTDSVPGYSLPILDLGSVLMYMDAYLAKYFPDSDWAIRTRNIYSYLVLGDPTMQVWVGGMPEPPRVTCPRWITLATQQLTITVRLQDRRPVEGARVCFRKPDRPVYVSGLTDEAGRVTLTVDPLHVGWMYITVSEGHAHSYPHTPILPYEDSIAVCLTGWLEADSLPRIPSGKAVKCGGWLTYDDESGLIYAAKGNKTDNFYAYDPACDEWTPQAHIWPGQEGKLPYKGCRGAADGQGKVYMVKGNKTLGFWKYTVADSSWTQMKNVPLSPSGKKVDKGSDMVFVGSGDSGYVYLLKGMKNDFYRFNVRGDTWETLEPPPDPYRHKWNEGSWLVFDGDHTIYAHKAKYQEFWSYDVVTGHWSTAALPGMPLGYWNRKTGEGSSAAWYLGSIYALKGGRNQELWRYRPTEHSWGELETIPVCSQQGHRAYVKSGADIVSGPPYVLYATKGNKTCQFWRYVPFGGGLDADTPGLGGLAEASSGGCDSAGETPISDGVEGHQPRWDPVPSSGMVVYSKEDTLTGYEAVYQRFYGSSIPEERVTDVATDCEEPVVSCGRPSGQLIAFQFMDTLSDCYQIAVTPAYANDGGGWASGSKEVQVESEVRANAVRSEIAGGGQSPARDAPQSGAVPAISAVPVRSLGCSPRSGAVPIGGTLLSRPIWQLTFGGNQDRLHPEFDEGGDWLCYERDVDGPGGCYTQIWRVPADGGSEEQVTLDNADHLSPKFLNAAEIVFTLSQDTGYDKIAKVNVLSHVVTILSSLATDHDNPDPAGQYVAAEALDEQGNSQIAKIPVQGGIEMMCTSGSSDITAPDYAPDVQSAFAVRWTGITSQIVCVNMQNGGYWGVTDSSAIRDNPDSHEDPNGPTSLAVYERETWSPPELLLDGKRRPGTGIYLSRFRKPHNIDGVEDAGRFTFALDKARPNPAASRVTIRWQVPVEADISLKVYNAAGQLVKVLADGRTKPGVYTSTWSGADTRGRRLANGVYFCTLDNGEKRISRKVVLTE